jgi:hypothetical protein
MAVKDGTADGSYKQEYTVTAIIITDFSTEISTCFAAAVNN